MSAQPVSRDYFFLTAGLSLAAVGVHAHAAAYAAARATNGQVPRAELQQRGMTVELERELLEAGLLQLGGDDVLVVALEVPSKDAVALSHKRAGDAKRQAAKRERRAAQATAESAPVPMSRDKSRDSGPSRDSAKTAQTSRDSTSRDAGESRDKAATSLTRAHAPGGAPPLLNVVEEREKQGISFRKSLSQNTADGSARERAQPVDEQLLEAIREILTVTFCAERDSVRDASIVAAICAAHHRGVDPIAAAHEAAVWGTNPEWRRRDAGETLAIVVRKFPPAAADVDNPPAQSIRTGWGADAQPTSASSSPVLAATSCPRAALTTDEVSELDAGWAQLLDELTGLLGDSTVDLWIRPCQLHVVTAEALTIAAPRVQAVWVRDRFVDALELAAAAIAGRQVVVDVVSCSCADNSERRAA